MPIFAQLGLYVPNGTSGVTSSSTGNVGVGVSSPAYSLHAAGAIGVAADQQFVARYNNSEAYKATLGWSHLQLGNNGPNWIVAGRNSAGGSLTFMVNNTADYSYGGFNGIPALHLAANGQVGVGTGSPSERLTLHGGGLLFEANPSVSINPEMSAAIRITSPGGWARGYGVIGAANQPHVIYGALGSGDSLTYAYIGPAYNTPWLAIRPSGNVGIGTTNPNSRLDIGGPTGAQYGTVAIKQAGAGQKGIWLQSYESNNALAMYHMNSYAVLSTDYTGTGTHVPLALQTTGGGVGIGTTNPGAHKLAVNGSMKAKEVVVETTGWSDYVFADGYELATLDEVEAHIREHKHLPGIPSAGEVAEHGVSVGEMQAKLLAKIEELTLHLIAQQKDIEMLKAQNAELLESGRAR